MSKKIDSKIEAKLISKIAYHRLMIRDLFRKRHRDVFDGLVASQCSHHLNELRVWLKMAKLIDLSNWVITKHKMPFRSVEPYETYYAKELTK